MQLSYECSVTFDCPLCFTLLHIVHLESDVKNIKNATNYLSTKTTTKGSYAHPFFTYVITYKKQR